MNFIKKMELVFFCLAIAIPSWFLRKNISSGGVRYCNHIRNDYHNVLNDKKMQKQELNGHQK